VTATSMTTDTPTPTDTATATDTPTATPTATGVSGGNPAPASFAESFAGISAWRAAVAQMDVRSRPSADGWAHLS
jgi:hypothetical protein